MDELNKSEAQSKAPSELQSIDAELEEKRKRKREPKPYQPSERRPRKGLKRFLAGLAVGLVLGALIVSGVAAAMNGAFAKKEPERTAYSQLIGDVILGQARETAELIVYEQDIMRVKKITKDWLGNLKIFSKAQYISYSGTGEFTVNLSKLSAQYITASDSAKSVTIVIPKALLKTVILNYDEIEYSDTINGFLSFGTLKLSPEETNAFNAEMEKTMWGDLESPDSKCLERANEIARLKCYQLFMPIIDAVAPGYSLTVLTEKV